MVELVSTPLFGFTVCLVIVALADVLAVITNAKIPTIAGSILIYTLLIQLGMPKIFPDVSQMGLIGDLLFSLYIVSIFTNFLPKMVVTEWKNVFIGLGGVICAYVLVLGIGCILFDPREVIACSGIVSGGGFYSGMMGLLRLQELGYKDLVMVPLAIVAFQDVIGPLIGAFPVTAYVKQLVKRDAYLTEPLLKNSDEGNTSAHELALNSAENPSPFFKSWIPAKYQTEAISLAQLAIVALLGTILAEFIPIPSVIITFALSALMVLLGFFRLNMLSRTGSAGFVDVAVMIMAAALMNDFDMNTFLMKLVPVTVIIVLSMIGLMIGGAITAKLFKQDMLLGASACVGMFYLFPSITLVMDNVLRSYARNDEEKAYLTARLSPSFLVIGSVSSKLSLVIASFLIPVFIK